MVRQRKAKNSVLLVLAIPKIAQSQIQVESTYRMIKEQVHKCFYSTLLKIQALIEPAVFDIIFFQSMYRHPSPNAFFVAAKKPRQAKFALCKSKYRKKNCKKNLHNAEILYYKIVLCKFFWTSSKNRVIQIRAMENRVSRGMPVYIVCTYFMHTYYKFYSDFHQYGHGEVRKEFKQSHEVELEREHMYV